MLTFTIRRTDGVRRYRGPNITGRRRYEARLDRGDINTERLNDGFIAESPFGDCYRLGQAWNKASRPPFRPTTQTPPVLENSYTAFLDRLVKTCTESHTTRATTPRLPARSAKAASVSGGPITTGWITREPTELSQLNDKNRTILAQTQVDSIFCLDYNDDTIAECARFAPESNKQG